ncbi:MAG: hypothetical protein ACJ8BE_18280 [Microvirga sp.]|jgi:hypothetical protein
MKALRSGLVLAASALVLAGCNHFATYTGTPRTAEFSRGTVAEAPDGFRTAICGTCESRAWRGYRDLGAVDASSEAAFTALARNFGAAYLGVPPDAASFSALAPFSHDRKEVGIKNLFTDRGTALAHSRLLGVVTANGGGRVFVHVTYSSINGSGKIYAATGASQGEAVANMAFALTARL